MKARVYAAHGQLWHTGGRVRAGHAPQRHCLPPGVPGFAWCTFSGITSTHWLRKLYTCTPPNTRKPGLHVQVHTACSTQCLGAERGWAKPYTQTQVLPMPLDDGELADIVREVGGKLVRLELQAVRTHTPWAE